MSGASGSSGSRSAKKEKLQRARALLGEAARRGGPAGAAARAELQRADAERAARQQQRALAAQAAAAEAAADAEAAPEDEAEAAGPPEDEDNAGGHQGAAGRDLDTGGELAQVRAQLLAAQREIAAFQALQALQAQKTSAAAAAAAQQAAAEATALARAAGHAEEEAELSAEERDEADGALQRAEDQARAGSAEGSQFDPTEALRGSGAAAEQRMAHLEAELAKLRQGAGRAVPSAQQEALARRSLLSSPASATGAHRQQREAPPAPASTGRTTANVKRDMAKWASGSDSRKLTAAGASKGTTLEDWIFEVERNLEAVEATTFEAQIQGAGQCWDRSVHIWFEGAKEAAAARGQPINSWPAFLATLRANYTPIADEETAWGMLIALRMRDSEGMEQYASRGQELYNRVPRARVPTEMAADLLINGVSSARFPFTTREVRARQLERRAAHQAGLSFEVTRGLLVAGATTEPGGSGRAASSPHGGSERPQQQQQQHGSKRINTVGAGIALAASRYPGPEEDAHGGSDAGAAGGQHAVSAVTAQGGGGQGGMRCFRCHETGHRIAECKKPDNRTCFACGKTGHRAVDCRSKQTAAGAAAPGGAKPKNE